jgi:hypothetical protein
MSVPSRPEPGRLSPAVPVVRIAPIPPWREPADLSYRIVELPTDQDPQGADGFPSVTWIARPAGAEASGPGSSEAPDVPIYPMAPLSAEDAAEEQRRRLREARIMELLILPATHQRRSGRRPPLRRETHWYQCLLFPLRAWPLFLALGAALATATAWLLALAMHAPEWRAYWFHQSACPSRSRC